MAFRSKKERFVKVSLFTFILVLAILFIVSPPIRRRSLIFLSPACITHEQKAFSRMLTDRIPGYSSRAKQAGIEECRNEKELRNLVKDGSLEVVRNNRFYTIGRLTHSYPYLTPGAHDLLEEIGRRFRKKTGKAGLTGTKFIVTSMTRTTEKLKGLRQNNSNASENSPHLYGNAFDISYFTFTSRKLLFTECDRTFFREALAEVIADLRAEKKCWATYERQQSCVHVVSRY